MWEGRDEEDLILTRADNRPSLHIYEAAIILPKPSDSCLYDTKYK